MRLSHRMLSLSLPELEQSAEQSRKDCKALQEERERREKELTQVRVTHRRNAVVCKEREEKNHRVDTVTFRVPHLRLISPGSTVPLISYGCIQAVHKSTVAAPTWTKWRFAKGLAMYEAAIQQPIRKTAVLNRRPAFVACWQLDDDITKSDQENEIITS